MGEQIAMEKHSEDFCNFFLHLFAWPLFCGLLVPNQYCCRNSMSRLKRCWSSYSHYVPISSWAHSENRIGAAQCGATAFTLHFDFRIISELYPPAHGTKTLMICFVHRNITSRVVFALMMQRQCWKKGFINGVSWIRFGSGGSVKWCFTCVLLLCLFFFRSKFAIWN